MSEARSEAEKLHAESEKARDEANQAIADLRQTEREHRERMKTHLEEMLAKVEVKLHRLTARACLPGPGGAGCRPDHALAALPTLRRRPVCVRAGALPARA